MFGAVYGRLSGARVIIHSDGTSHSERVLGRAHLLARRVLLREAAACVANSEPAARRFAELGASREQIFKAPHTTNIAPFHAVAGPRRTTQRVPLTVLHVGRLIPRKGVDRLIRAVALAAADVRLRLVLVGSGPEAERLRQLSIELGIGDDVEFRGFVDQPGLPSVYADADVFAFPTLDDPYGIVLLEAAAAGLPIVASPHGGATLDLIEHGKNGYIVDPEDVDAWAAALVALARDPGTRDRLGTAAHDVTLDRTPARAAEGYVDAVSYALRDPADRAYR
jgi:glycosyltransferase involved in cell wall biosynthesis